MNLSKHLVEHVPDIESGGDLDDTCPFVSCSCGWRKRLGHTDDWAKHVADTWTEGYAVILGQEDGTQFVLLRKVDR